MNLYYIIKVLGYTAFIFIVAFILNYYRPFFHIINVEKLPIYAVSGFYIFLIVDLIILILRKKF